MCLNIFENCGAVESVVELNTLQVHLISTYRMTNCQARNDSIATKIAQYLNKYYSFNFRTIPKAEVGYFGQETEKTATLGKDRYTVT